MSPELTIDLFVLFQICETLFKVQHCLHKFGKFKPHDRGKLGDSI